MRQIILAGCVTLLTMSLVSCKESAQAKEEHADEAVVVTVAKSTVGPVQREVSVVGTLYGDEEATVSAKVPGRITEILMDVGDRAAPGEALAQIDRTDYELAVAQKRMAMQASLAKLGLSELPTHAFDPTKVPTVERSRLESENAKAKYNRAQQLFQQKPPLISEQDYADIQTAYEVAKSNYDVELLTARSQLADARSRTSELDQESQRLRDATIRAPLGSLPTTMPGNHATTQRMRYAVAARLISVGEYVREGNPLFRLVADDPIKFRAQVPEKFLGQVKVGQKARVSVDAYREPFEGVVARISPQVEIASRTFGVEMLVRNGDEKLQSGAFARGGIFTRTDANVTFVPLNSIITFAGVSKVFTIEGGKAIEHKIETGQRMGDQIEIVSGLSGAMDVVISGGNKLSTGTPVRVQ